MNAELFFIYDSHCPWSYAASSLVNVISKNYPDIKLNLWHCARYEGDELVSKQTIDDVVNFSECKFSSHYLDKLSLEKDSTISANLLAWTQTKVPHLTLPLLNALQEKHFQQGIALTSESDFSDIINELKISPPNKIFNNEKLTKEAEMTLHAIFELQEVIQTSAIPAVLLAVGDNLTLLNHNLYLQEPSSIVEAIKLELNK